MMMNRREPTSRRVSCPARRASGWSHIKLMDLNLDSDDSWGSRDIDYLRQNCALFFDAGVGVQCVLALLPMSTYMPCRPFVAF